MTEVGNRIDHQTVQLESQPRAQHRCAQHAHRILDEPHARIANRPNDPPLEIVQAADVIDDGFGRGVIEERVDGEIAAEGVFFSCAERIIAVDDAAAFASVAGARESTDASARLSAFALRASARRPPPKYSRTARWLASV
jgi:hypothetical protein